MSPEARQYLIKCAGGFVTAGVRDPAWKIITELQHAGLARLDWVAAKSARIVPTESGFAELAKDPP